MEIPESSTLLRAITHLRRSLRADGADAKGAEGDEWSSAAITRQWRPLIAWGEENSLILPENFPPPGSGGGREHDVRFDAPNRVWWKYTRGFSTGFAVTWNGRGRPFLHGGRPLDYLMRLRLQNRLFQDDIRLAGFWKNSLAGEWRVVTTQPDISGTPASVEEISAFMQSLGWIPAPEWNGLGYSRSLTFRRGSCLAADAHPANFVRTGEGVIVPIDLILTRRVL